MTTKFIETIYDEATGETIEQEMNAAAIKELKETQEKWAVIRQKEEALESARTSAIEKLAALGLTADEVNGLISR
jgi:hypothetical protein